MGLLLVHYRRTKKHYDRFGWPLQGEPRDILEELIWPPKLLCKGERLLTDDAPDWQNNACPASHGADHAWDAIASGFRLAARRLVQSIMQVEPDRWNVDLLFYPIYYLYRHHFELVLKCLDLATRQYANEPDAPDKGHKLHPLWEKCRRRLETHFPNEDWSQNGVVASLLLQFEQTGQAGRYPVPVNRGQADAAFFGDVERANVRHFADVCERMAEYLYQILAGIEAEVEQRREWESAMMSQVGCIDWD